MVTLTGSGAEGPVGDGGQTVAALIVRDTTWRDVVADVSGRTKGLVGQAVGSGTDTSDAVVHGAVGGGHVTLHGGITE